MAFLVKNVNKGRAIGAASGDQGYLMQHVQVNTAARALPATTTDQIFRVRGGRVLVHLLIGEVTTIMQAQANNIKLTSKKLDVASLAVGTAVDICANSDGNAKEVGSLYVLLGSGAAPVWSNAGAGIATLGRIPFILPQGEVYVTTSATSTGAMKWDMFYQPLDAGSYVDSVVSAVVAI